jgi:lysophospholipase L1-like esterase
VLSTSDHGTGHRSAPSSTVQARTGEASFTYSADQHGFRNTMPWPAQADIVAVGDSMVFGYGVNDDQTWIRLLADSLPGSRVINLGRAGQGPQQYLQAYEEFGAPLKPKLLLFGLSPSNDVIDAKRFDEWLQAGKPSDSEAPVENRLAWLQQSYLLKFVGSLNDVVTPFSGETIDCGNGGRLRLVPGLYASRAKMAHPGDPSFELVMDTIEEAGVLTRQQGTELLVVLFPTKEEVYLPVSGKPVPLLLEPFRAELEKRDIPHLDFTPFFQEEARRGECVFFEVDGHPNVRGEQLIAKVLADMLRNRADLSHPTME